jgi:hypothetical protein
VDHGLATYESLGISSDHRLDPDNVSDVRLVWKKLHKSPEANIELATLNLLVAAHEVIGHVDFDRMSDEELKLVMTRYNADVRHVTSYGEQAFATYKATSGFSKKICTPFTGRLTLDDNWQVGYSTATVPQNYFEYTLWKKVIHKTTDLDESSIHMLMHDTDRNEDSIPDILGEMTKGPIQLVQKCCNKLQELRVSSPLPITVEESYDPTDDINDAAWGAAIVEVSVDIITYKPIIKGIWTCFDIGDTINEDISKHYLTQRIINSLYWCTSPGEDETSSWRFANLPISISLLNSQGSDTVNYCGDIPFAIIPSAYCNAISQAVGKVITDMPVTPEKLFLNISLLRSG